MADRALYFQVLPVTVAGQKGLFDTPLTQAWQHNCKGGGVTGHMPHPMLSHCRQTGVMLRHRDIWGSYCPGCKRG